MTNRRTLEPETLDESILLVALNEYMNDRADNNEVVTEQAALKITAVARSIGVSVADNTHHRGFFVYNGCLRSVLYDVILSAQRHVEVYDTANKADELCTLCCGKTVAELESLNIEK